MLDGGCGSGSHVLQLAQHVDFLIGIDNSSAMVKIAYKRRIEQNCDNVAFILADLERLPFQESAFDFVISNRALHHTELNESLPGLRRVVRPGGRILVSEVILRFPLLFRLPIWRMFNSFLKALKIAFKKGLRQMWNFLRFRLSSGWMRQGTEMRMGQKEFQKVYRKWFSECRFLENERGWVFWEAPK